MYEGTYWTDYDHTFGRKVDLNDPLDCVSFIMEAVYSANEEANAYFQEPFTGRFIGQNTFVVLPIPLEMEMLEEDEHIHEDEDELGYYGD